MSTFHLNKIGDEPIVDYQLGDDVIVDGVWYNIDDIDNESVSRAFYLLNKDGEGRWFNEDELG